MELKPLLSQLGPQIAELLIVPYGIETMELCFCHYAGTSFNRTLWN